MNNQSRSSRRWSLRRLLRTGPGVLAATPLPRNIFAALASANLPAFSQFVDVARSAELTQAMPCGEGSAAPRIEKLVPAATARSS